MQTFINGKYFIQQILPSKLRFAFHIHQGIDIKYFHFTSISCVLRGVTIAISMHNTYSYGW